MANAGASYLLMAHEEGAAELDPEKVISAVVNSCREVITKSNRINPGGIEAVGLSGFWHSLVAVGKDDRALTPLYTWADRRSYPQSVRLRRELKNDIVHQRTGCVLHPVYLPSKILWLKQEKRDIFRKTKMFCSMKEYLILRLFGNTFCDFSIASGSGLLNIQTKEWDSEILESIGISNRRLSPLVNSDWKLSGLKHEFSIKTGLSSNVPWIIGSGDGACSSIGSGCISENSIALMLGTSAAMRVMTTCQNINLLPGLWCYLADKDHYLIGGAINNAGLVMSWLKNVLKLPWNLEAVLKSRKPCQHRLTFLPLLSGERCPDWTPRAKASILGLTLSTSAEDILRAGLESVGYRLLEILALMKKSFPDTREIVVSGGIIQSAEWMRIITDILGVSLSVSFENEASSLGAAVIAMKATGMIEDYRIPGYDVAKRTVLKPIRENHKDYLNAYRIYREYKKILSRD